MSSTQQQGIDLLPQESAGGATRYNPLQTGGVADDESSEAPKTAASGTARLAEPSAPGASDGTSSSAAASGQGTQAPSHAGAFGGSLSLPPMQLDTEQLRQQAVDAGKETAWWFTLFPDFVQERALKRSTRRYAVQHVQGQAASCVFVGVLFVAFLALLVPQLRRRDQPGVQESPTLTDYDALALRQADPGDGLRSLSCPCTQLSAPLGTFATLQAKLDPMCGPGLKDTLLACRSSTRCVGQAASQLLRSIFAFCDLANASATLEVGDATARRVVSAQLMARETLEAQVEAARAGTQNAAVTRFSIPLQQSIALTELEQPLTVPGLMGGQRAPQPFFPSAPGGPAPPDGLVWPAGAAAGPGGGPPAPYTFSFTPCISLLTPGACRTRPFCRWTLGDVGRGTGAFCDSTVCPARLSQAACGALGDSCSFLQGTTGGQPSLCLDKACENRDGELGCGANATGVPMDMPLPRCQILRGDPLPGQGPGSASVQCAPAPLRCHQLATESDCNSHGPSRVCRWRSNGTASQCEHVASLTCSNGTRVVSAGPGAGPIREWPCEPDEATEVGTDPIGPTLLALTWPESEASGLPSQGPGVSQSSSKPEVLQFATAPGGPQVSMRDPLWRRAISAGGETCFEDYLVRRNDEVALVPPSIEAPIPFQWRCSRASWVASFSTRLLSSKVWTLGFGLPRAPLEDAQQSRFPVIAAGVISGFMDRGSSNSEASLPNGTGVAATTDYAAYFGSCAPARCSYVESRLPSAAEALGSVLATVGGLTVVVRTGVVTAVGMLLGGWAESFVRARPETYPEAVFEDEEDVGDSGDDDDDNGEGSGGQKGSGGGRGQKGQVQRVGTAGGNGSGEAGASTMPRVGPLPADGGSRSHQGGEEKGADGTTRVGVARASGGKRPPGPPRRVTGGVVTGGTRDWVGNANPLRVGGGDNDVL